ncbi:MAG TPA: HNH endonuclease signature motif containing protein [Phycisphaerae bacterium]
MSAWVSAALAAEVAARAGGRCEYCHAPQILIGQAFHIDHILPQSRGGRSESANLCLACSHCNIAKSGRSEARDPRTGRVVRLFNPRRDLWTKHFPWSPNGTMLIGKTVIARATVSALDMNAELLRAARPFWRWAGLVP